MVTPPPAEAASTAGNERRAPGLPGAEPSPEPPRSEPQPADVPTPGRSARPLAAVVAAALVLSVSAGTWIASRDRGAPPAHASDSPVPASPAAAESPALTGPLASANERIPIQSVTPGVTYTRDLGDIAFSYRVPKRDWDLFRRTSLNKSTVGPQGAEAMVFWSLFPDDDTTDPCLRLLGRRIEWSAAGLAAAVASAPGVELVTEPEDFTLGGQSATHLSLVVRERVGCRPGFFLSWHAPRAGPLWTEMVAGDAMDVWIAEVSGTIFVLAAATTDQADEPLFWEIRQIVASVRFD
jgi:hypothetical protein